jgi:hypothetical protein
MHLIAQSDDPAAMIRRQTKQRFPETFHGTRSSYGSSLGGSHCLLRLSLSRACEAAAGSAGYHRNKKEKST